MQTYRREKVWETGNVYSNDFQDLLIKKKRSGINSELTYVYMEISTYINLSGMKFEALVHISTH